jgi:hypothetical protein
MLVLIAFLIAAWVQFVLARYIVRNDSLSLWLGGGRLRFLQEYAETINAGGLIPLMVVAGVFSIAAVALINALRSDRDR